MLDNNWFNEYIFSNFGINYSFPAGSKLIIYTIWLMRQDQKDDFKKIWARKTFSRFIPDQLINYVYKADHIGNLIDGINNSKKEINELFKITYNITKFDEFKESSLNFLIYNAHLYNDSQIKLILARVSFANWIYALVRENKIIF